MVVRETIDQVWRSQQCETMSGMPLAVHGAACGVASHYRRHRCRDRSIQLMPPSASLADHIRERRRCHLSSHITPPPSPLPLPPLIAHASFRPCRWQSTSLPPPRRSQVKPNAAVTSRLRSHNKSTLLPLPQPPLATHAFTVGPMPHGWQTTLVADHDRVESIGSGACRVAPR